MTTRQAPFTAFAHIGSTFFVSREPAIERLLHACVKPARAWRVPDTTFPPKSFPGRLLQAKLAAFAPK
jgi:hypothetical protein